MDVHKILAALRQEHTHIEAVIANLECLALSRERRRGRPSAIFAAARKRGRPRGSKNKTLPASPHVRPAPWPPDNPLCLKSHQPRLCDLIHAITRANLFSALRDQPFLPVTDESCRAATARPVAT